MSEPPLPAVSFRVATPGDAPSLAAIYKPYVEHTAITFEYDVPSAEEFARRIASTVERHPYLVAEDEQGHIYGYAYASPLKQRAAYDWAVELSVYLDRKARGRRLGTRFYDLLTKILSEQHVTNVYACITYSTVEDDLHDNSSLRFHLKHDFKEVAHFHECGFKFGRWWDILWMEKTIAPRKAVMEPFVPFSQLACTVEDIDLKGRTRQ